MFAKIFVSVFAVCIALLGSVSDALAGKRVALVIGNSNYISSGALINPERDARAVADKLGRLGFEVVEGYDLALDEMRDTVRRFARQTRDAELTVFFYAGHGISVDQVNYLVPIDAAMTDPLDWEFEVYALPDILRLVSRAESASLVFLDACRDNPMARQLAKIRGMSTRSFNERGIFEINAEALSTTGSVVAYATEPGDVAYDGEGANSPFTTALLRHIGTANADFAAQTSLITRDVLDMTGGAQRPRFDVSLTGPLVLNRVAMPAAQSTASAPAMGGGGGGASMLDVEKVIFDAARDSGDVADYQAYLDSFPNGVFAVLARNAIARQQSNSGGTQVTQAVAQGNTATQGETQLAAATMNYRSADPLILTATPAARALQSSQITEEQLALSRTQRKEMQLRLNLSGNNVGRPDGIVGPGTRRGISSWQAQSGFVATGFLNTVQHQMLVANTESAFAQHMAANPKALSAPVRKSSGTSKKKSSGNAASIGAFIGGVAAGIILSK